MAPANHVFTVGLPDLYRSTPDYHEMNPPLYATAIILPALAFPAWILCVPPFMWHFSQRNIAAWSLILWIILMNFFNSINPLIWPRDNVDEWFDGNVLCDIEVRVYVGASVALASCTAMIMRKLGNVMDTRNITIAPSRGQVIRDKVLEVLWCWGYPALLILLYYIVQPLRYYVFGISGCVVAYNLSWVTIILSTMWGPITICFTSYYAGVLLYRLYRYRREFHRLIAARNTTKSRFIRLFTMSMIVVVFLVPYNGWVMWLNASQTNEPFDWDYVHGAAWNTHVKVVAGGQVRLDRWGQVATGYITFAVLGTGADAHNTYKRMLCAMGLGKIFPSLYIMSESGAATPSSFIVARGWCSTCAGRVRNIFTGNGSVTETTSTRNNSMTLEGMLSTPRSGSLIPVATNEPMLKQRASQPSHNKQSILGRIFARRNRRRSILPIFAKKTVDDGTEMEKSPTDTFPPGGVHSYAWASDSPTAARHPEPLVENAVHVVQELRQEHHFRNQEKPKD